MGYEPAPDSLLFHTRYTHSVVEKCINLGESLFLEVLDDGARVSDVSTRLKGVGIQSMHYRARMLRGRLEVGQCSPFFYGAQSHHCGQLTSS